MQERGRLWRRRRTPHRCHRRLRWRRRDQSLPLRQSRRARARRRRPRRLPRPCRTRRPRPLPTQTRPCRRCSRGQSRPEQPREGSQSPPRLERLKRQSHPQRERQARQNRQQRRRQRTRQNRRLRHRLGSACQSRNRRIQSPRRISPPRSLRQQGFQNRRLQLRCRILRRQSRRAKSRAALPRSLRLQSRPARGGEDNVGRNSGGPRRRARARAAIQARGAAASPIARCDSAPIQLQIRMPGRRWSLGPRRPAGRTKTARPWAPAARSRRARAQSPARAGIAIASVAAARSGPIAGRCARAARPLRGSRCVAIALRDSGRPPPVRALAPRRGQARSGPRPRARRARGACDRGARRAVARARADLWRAPGVERRVDAVIGVATGPSPSPPLLPDRLAIRASPPRPCSLARSPRARRCDLRLARI